MTMMSCSARLETSLISAGDKVKYVFLHYPPRYKGYECKEILDLLAAMDLKKVILVGAEFGALQEYAEDIDSKVKPLFFADVEALKVYLHKEHLKNHTILVKGSNGIRLQSIIPEL